MQKTILSIDLGTAWVKILKTQVGIRNESVLNFKLVRVYPEDTPDSIANKVYNAVEQNDLFADQNLLAINSGDALYQELTFPFTQQNKIKQVLPLELEANIPVNLSDYSWNYYLTNTGGKQCKAFCVLQDKDSIRQWLDAFQEAVEADIPYVLDFHVDPDEHILPMMKPGGKLDNMIDKEDI